MPGAVIEPCPEHLQHLDQPRYGGHLFFHLELGRAGCQHCGWSGVPTRTDGDVPRLVAGRTPPGFENETRLPARGDRPSIISTRCPCCERDYTDLPVKRVPRNKPCPCGSGLKAKRCGCAGYTV